MTVWLVMVNGRVNSAWERQEHAGQHGFGISRVNGENVTVVIESLEVRTGCGRVGLHNHCPLRRDGWANHDRTDDGPDQ